MARVDPESYVRGKIAGLKKAIRYIDVALKEEAWHYEPLLKILRGHLRNEVDAQKTLLKPRLFDKPQK